MLLDLLYSEDIDIKDLEKYFLASSQGQAPRFSPKNFITWFFHLVSDMAGSSSTVGITGGTGIPGPILALANEVFAIPLFKNMKVDDNMSVSIFLSKLFGEPAGQVKWLFICPIGSID